MHEISLCQNMRHILDEAAQENDLTVISKVHLLVGDLTCVETSALEFAFSVCMKESIAQEAELHIIPVEGKALCNQCGNSFASKHFFTPCPRCESNEIQIISGEELTIQSVEAH